MISQKQIIQPSELNIYVALISIFILTLSRPRGSPLTSKFVWR